MASRTSAIVVAVNDEAILARNLRASPDARAVPVVELWSQPSASVAYNLGASEASAEVLVFAHQDVYLPAGWMDRLHAAIDEVVRRHGDWGVLGVYGLRSDGTHVGHCWSSGLQRELGSRFAEPCAIVSADELVLVVNGRSGLQFDPALPGFHLYGTDIVQSSLQRGLGAFAVHNPVVHNSRRVRTLAGAYTTSYRYMQRKWRSRLPIPTSVIALTRLGIPLLNHRVRTRLRRALGSETCAVGTALPMGGADISRRLGYE